MTPNPQDSAVALEVELLPCPFCGGAGEAFDVHTLTWHVRYGCQSCQVFFNDAEVWNRRASDGTSGVPEGWKPAPMEPTDEMLKAGRKAIHDSHSVSKKALLVYQAMLAAAPNQGENHVG